MGFNSGVIVRQPQFIVLDEHNGIRNDKQQHNHDSCRKSERHRNCQGVLGGLVLETSHYYLNPFCFHSQETFQRSVSIEDK